MNLKTNDFVVCTPEMHNLIVEVAAKAGIRVYHSTLNKRDPNYPNLKWDGNQLVGTRSKKGEFGERTVERFLQDILGTTEKQVVLNASYTAIVSKEGVKVGCQDFPHSIIKEIQDAIDEIGSDSKRWENLPCLKIQDPSAGYRR